MLRLLMERALNSLISRNNVIYVLDASGCDDDRKCQFFFATRFFSRSIHGAIKNFPNCFCRRRRTERHRHKLNRIWLPCCWLLLHEFFGAFGYCENSFTEDFFYLSDSLRKRINLLDRIRTQPIQYYYYDYDECIEPMYAEYVKLSVTSSSNFVNVDISTYTARTQLDSRDILFFLLTLCYLQSMCIGV